MKDKVSIERIQKLHPLVREKFTAFIDEIEAFTGLTFRIVQGLRTIAEQDALFAQGRTKPGAIVTKARGGSSYHNYGLAIDIVPLKANGEADWKYKYENILAIALKHGLTWGGNFKSIVDKPHYELTFGYHWKKLLDMASKKQFIPGTEYVDIKINPL